MRARFLFVFTAIFLFGFRCSLPWESCPPSNFTIVSYNAHNFFDDVDAGTEYPEFRLDSGTWNAELYKTRLKNTAKALLSFFPEGETGPDIICLQEIESEKVLKDLAAGQLAKQHYRWIALGGPVGSAIKCGFLSRYPFVSIRAHSLSDAWGYGAGRDILEGTFDLGSKAGMPEDPSKAVVNNLLTVFVCHWKSRKEGAAETEAARIGASRLVAARLKEIGETDPGRNIVICGDFNESPDEFSRAAGKYPTGLMPDYAEFFEDRTNTGLYPSPDWFDKVLRVSGSPAKASIGEGGVTLFSPWSGVEGFSYKFEGEPERLDGFLLGPSLVDGAGLDFGRFRVSDDPDLFDDMASPRPWNGSSGYSDHLPIALTLECKGSP
jgi:endonuclease/exonuclease/phosphatase family metal-dependent hydrolase